MGGGRGGREGERGREGEEKGKEGKEKELLGQINLGRFIQHSSLNDLQCLLAYEIKATENLQ